MQGIEGINVLFVVGFGPIVRDTTQSRKLYSEVLGIPFKEESGEYLHTEAPLQKQRLLHCGRSLRPHSRVLAKNPGLTMWQFHNRFE